jgi:hypothetical protein
MSSSLRHRAAAYDGGDDAAGSADEHDVRGADMVRYRGPARDGGGRRRGGGGGANPDQTMEALLSSQRDLFALLYDFIVDPVHGVFHSMYAQLHKAYDNEEDLFQHVQFSVLQTKKWNSDVVASVAGKYRDVADNCSEIVKQLTKCQARIAFLSGLSAVCTEDADLSVSFPDVFHAILICASRLVASNLHVITAADSTRLALLLHKHRAVEDAVATLCRHFTVETKSEAAKVDKIARRLAADYRAVTDKDEERRKEEAERRKRFEEQVEQREAAARERLEAMEAHFERRITEMKGEMESARRDAVDAAEAAARRAADEALRAERAAIEDRRLAAAAAEEERVAAAAAAEQESVAADAATEERVTEDANAVEDAAGSPPQSPPPSPPRSPSPPPSPEERIVALPVPPGDGGGGGDDGGPPSEVREFQRAVGSQRAPPPRAAAQRDLLRGGAGPANVDIRLEALMNKHLRKGGAARPARWGAGDESDDDDSYFGEPLSFI